MSDRAFVVAAYALTWSVLLAYVRYLAVRVRRAQHALDALPADTSSEGAV